MCSMGLDVTMVHGNTFGIKTIEGFCFFRIKGFKEPYHIGETRTTFDCNTKNFKWQRNKFSLPLLVKE